MAKGTNQPLAPEQRQQLSRERLAAQVDAQAKDLKRSAYAGFRAMGTSFSDLGKALRGDERDTPDLL